MATTTTKAQETKTIANNAIFVNQMYVRVATAPKTRNTINGKTLCEFRVIQNEEYGKQSNGFTVTCWGKTVEVASEKIKIGSLLMLKNFRVTAQGYMSEDNKILVSNVININSRRQLEF